MSLSPSELEQVVRELSSLVGAPVQKIHAPVPRWLYLELRVPGESLWLCLCAEPEVARLSLSSWRVPAPSEPPSFQRRVRHELVGAKLARVALEAEGRVVRLRFDRDVGPASLVLELSRGGELYLLDAEDRVLAASAGAKSERLAEGKWVAPPSGGPQSTRPSRLHAEEGAPYGLLRAADALFAERERARLLEEIRRRLLARQKTRRDRLARTQKKVEAEQARTSDGEDHRRLGELLTQNLFRIPRGAKSATLTEYTAEGAREVEIPLDPKKSPREQAEWHFHQYRRLLRGVEHAERRWLELEAEREKLDREAERIRALPEEALWKHLDLLSAAARRNERPEARPYKEFLSADGSRIWVGKGAEANDALTFKVARAQDVWLHARGLPGSHVVVPLEKHQELLPEVLLDAAHLALHFSQAKGEPRAEVSYVKAKFLRKVKGGPPGRVTYTREKTFMCRVEPERIERLLRSRAEENEP